MYLTSRRAFLGGLGVASGMAARLRGASVPPNVVLINADDLGYGDLGCYGSAIRTPNIDKMAAEGVRFEHFYSASPVCSPSRVGLLTGRYPARTNVRRVLMPIDDVGIQDSEQTIPQALKPASYRSSCIGKWHLGALPRFLPTAHGFDEFYGLPYSHDMTPLPLMRNNEVINKDVSGQTPQLTQQFTTAAVDFISANKARPFFLYYAPVGPHIPLGVSEQFKGKSALGPYGDMVEELDWSAGQILSAIKSHGLDENTLVMFTSDNGPWYQGSPGRLRGRKGETWEGGMRIPFVARFPGRIPEGRVSKTLATQLDVAPTIGRLTGVGGPASAVDGADIWPMMTGEASVDRGLFLYFDGIFLQCARFGKWKLHMSRYNSVAWTPDPPGGRLNLPLFTPELYDLESDPGETCDVSAANPDVVSDIKARMEASARTFPSIIWNAWLGTQARKPDVFPTPSGALPTLSDPNAINDSRWIRK